METLRHALSLLVVLLVAHGCDSGASTGIPDCPDGAWRVCVTEERTWGRRACTGGEWESVCQPPQCTPGAEEACETPCGSSGERWCADDGWWQPCVGREICDAEDNDCDGAVDEGLEELCHCGFRYGVRRCEAGVWLTCDTGHKGTPEVCNGEDDDCDAAVDEDLQRPCQTICEGGFEVCEDGAWVDCTARPPTEEVCNNIDDDCDGALDEDQPEQECGIGECRRLLPTCAGGAPVWCDPYHGAVKEVCDQLDNDCDGDTDEDAKACCEPGVTRACSLSVGECLEGLSLCGDDGTWGACSGQVPTPELCNGIDDDCDGETDEGEPGINQPCGSDFALCKSGMTGCVGGLPECLGDVPGVEEICDGKDNDCDGLTDDGLVELVEPFEPNDTCETATLLEPVPSADGGYIMLPWTLYRTDGGGDVDWFEIRPVVDAVGTPGADDSYVMIFELVAALDDPEDADVQLCYSKFGCKPGIDMVCPEHDIVSIVWTRAWGSPLPGRSVHLRIKGPPSCRPYGLAVQVSSDFLAKGHPRDWNPHPPDWW